MLVYDLAANMENVCSFYPLKNMFLESFQQISHEMSYWVLLQLTKLKIWERVDRNNSCEMHFCFDQKKQKKTSNKDPVHLRCIIHVAIFWIARKLWNTLMNPLKFNKLINNECK